MNEQQDGSIRDLNAAMDDMRRKMQMLGESALQVKTGGFDILIRAAEAASRQPRKDEGDITRGALPQMLGERLKEGFFAPSFGGRAGGPTVVIHNNAGAAVSARESPGAFDEKYLEITIDQMVAGALLRGRQTSGVLSTLFNIVPGLIGR